jgi:hypothetical protein
LFVLDAAGRGDAVSWRDCGSRGSAVVRDFAWLGAGPSSPTVNSLRITRTSWGASMPIRTDCPFTRITVMVMFSPI